MRHRRGDHLRVWAAVEPDDRRLRKDLWAGREEPYSRSGRGLVQPAMAALANGACAHAFELDGSTKPSVGVHPCATIFPAALAIAQERGFGGRDLITAFVAATEVVLRIGSATKHSNEIRGFHAPGTTGPFGAVVGGRTVVGIRSGQDDQRARYRCVALVRARAVLPIRNRWHGEAPPFRPCERKRRVGGEPSPNAASTGPHDVIEGEFGFLRVFCDEFDMSELTAGLGETFLSR